MKKITKKIIAVSIAAGMAFPAFAALPAEICEVNAASSVSDLFPPDSFNECMIYSALNSNRFDRNIFTAPVLVNFNQEHQFIDKPVIFENECTFREDIIINGNTELRYGRIDCTHEDQQFVTFGDLSTHGNLEYSFENIPGDDNLNCRIVCDGKLTLGQRILNKHGEAKRPYSSSYTYTDPWGFETSTGSSSEPEYIADNRLIDIYCSDFEGQGGGEIEANMYCTDSQGLSKLYSGYSFSGNIVTEGSLAINGDVRINGDLIVGGSLYFSNAYHLKVSGNIIVCGDIIGDNVEEMMRFVECGSLITSEYGSAALYEGLPEVNKLKEFMDLSVYRGYDFYNSFYLNQCSRNKEKNEYQFYNGITEMLPMVDYNNLHGGMNTVEITQSAYIHGSIEANIVYIRPLNDEDIYIKFDNSADISGSRIIVSQSYTGKCHFILGNEYFRISNSTITTDYYENMLDQTGRADITQEDNINIYFHAPETCKVEILESTVCGHASNINLDTVLTQNSSMFTNRSNKKVSYNGITTTYGFSPFWIGSLSSLSESSADHICGDYLYVVDPESFLTPMEPLDIYEQPSDVTVTEGEKADFFVASNYADAEYQWQYSKDGENWYNISKASAKTQNYTADATLSKDGWKFRCVVSYEDQQVVSYEAVLSVKASLSIVKQPEDVKAVSGSKAVFSVTAEGENPSYQWQYSSTGSKWTNISGATKSSYTTTATDSRNGRLFRCVVTSGSSKVTSNSAKLTVKQNAVITEQPSDVTAAPGKTAVFAVKAEGDNLTYQWQYSKNGGTTWYTISKDAARKAEYATSATSDKNSWMFRCKITGESGSVISDAALLTVKEPVSITKQPVSYTGKTGTTAKFSVTAEGDNLSYQWQYSRSGSSWKNSCLSGNKTASLSVKLTESRDGLYYRCIITDSEGNQKITEKVTISTADVLRIVTQPVSQDVEPGKKAEFSVTVSGTGLKYQWQYSGSSSGTWKNFKTEGADTEKITVSGETADQPVMYLRCVIIDENGEIAVTSAVKLTNTVEIC